MVILNSALLQWHIFENIKRKLAPLGVNSVEVYSTITPTPDLFGSILTGSIDQASYCRFISSSYRVDVGGETYYFFFRNKKDTSQGSPVYGSYTWPSSVQVIRRDGNDAVPVFKFHFFTFNPNVKDSIMTYRSTPLFVDDQEMKDCIRVLSDAISSAFVKALG